MSALTNIWHSEKGLFGVALIIGVTVLTALGHVTAEAWIDYTKWIFAFYVGGKTIQGAASVLATRPAQPSTPSSGPAVAVVNNPPA